RGSDERPGLKNQGNLLKLVKLISSDNRDVENVVLGKAPQNAKFTFWKGIKGYKQSKKRNQSIEETEEIVDRKLVLRDAERDEKRDAERDAARDAEIEVESESVEREASNEGRLQKRRKQSCYRYHSLAADLQ
nr:hypothetical protein [Tanacetum cinerariifolium]